MSATWLDDKRCKASRRLSILLYASAMIPGESPQTERFFNVKHRNLKTLLQNYKKFKNPFKWFKWKKNKTCYSSKWYGRKIDRKYKIMFRTFHYWNPNKFVHMPQSFIEPGLAPAKRIKNIFCNSKKRKVPNVFIRTLCRNWKIYQS